MTRKRGTAFRAALIASLAVAFGVGSSALATTPPSEPAGGGGGECPRDIAAAAAAATTVPETTAAPATTAAAAAPATTAAAAPETTAAAPVETAPPPTLPANVSELDAESTSATSTRSRATPCSRAARSGLAVGSLAENWNPGHPDGNELDFDEVLEPMAYYAVARRQRGRAHARTPTTCSSSPSPRTASSQTYTLNPEAVWHSGEPITAEDWQRRVDGEQRREPGVPDHQPRRATS